MVLVYHESSSALSYSSNGIASSAKRSSSVKAYHVVLSYLNLLKLSLIIRPCFKSDSIPRLIWLSDQNGKYDFCNVFIELYVQY